MEIYYFYFKVVLEKRKYQAELDEEKR